MKDLRGPSRNNFTNDETAFVAIRYEPVAEIGTGGMGSVALARALSGPAAGKYVAIKRMHAHLEKDPKVMESFIDEVWLVSALHHPNVVEPLDWGRDDEGSYLVMQFVPGDSLRALLRARENAQAPLPIDVVVEMIARAAEGLHAAHELKDDDGESLQLVHRDVSPANVLIGYDGTVKVIDFGVAKAAGKMVKTESGLIKGKYAYMSPEQIRGQNLDRRSDIFSLGVCAWEALTLCRLYNAPTEFDMLQLICEEQPVPPSEIRGDVPPALDRIVLKCLAKRADDRFPTAHVLANELRALRPPPAAARTSIATLAREAMPERLAWIEQVTGRKVDISEPPLAVPPDATSRVPSLYDSSDTDKTRGPSAPGAPTPQDEFPTDRERRAASPFAPDAIDSPANPARPATPGSPATLPAPPMPSRPQPFLTRVLPPERRAALRAQTAAFVHRSTTTVRTQAHALWSRTATRTAILVGALGAVAVIAMWVGVWLGQR